VNKLPCPLVTALSNINVCTFFAFIIFSSIEQLFLFHLPLIYIFFLSNKQDVKPGVKRFDSSFSKLRVVIYFKSRRPKQTACLGSREKVIDSDWLKVKVTCIMQTSEYRRCSKVGVVRVSVCIML